MRYGTTVSWPAVEGGIGANGNSGMVSAAAANPYSVAYIGVSYAAPAAKAGLGVAALKDADGQYVLPTAETVGADAASVVTDTPPDERISMIFAHGANAYPIANYEYAIINAKQPDADHRGRPAHLPELGGDRRQCAAVPGPGSLPAAADRDPDPLQDPDRENQVTDFLAAPPGANREGFM